MALSRHQLNEYRKNCSTRYACFYPRWIHAVLKVVLQIQSLREDVNAMKLNAAVETQVNRESPPEIFRNPQFCQELEKLIHLEPCNTIQQLEEIVKGIKEELYRTETTLNFFKCEEFPKEVELVKSGLNKVVSDLKDFFGTGRPQKLSNEVSFGSLVLSIEILFAEFLAILHLKSLIPFKTR
jgi:hypothetical protein